MDEFQISVKTLRKEVLNVPSASSSLTQEQIKAQLESNMVMRVPGTATFRLKDQTFIPHYALDLSTSKYHFREGSNNEITDIEYPRLTGSGNNPISNNINAIMDYMFNYWTIGAQLMRVPFVKEGVQKHIFIGPGIMLDSEGKILCSLVYKKELVTKLNLIEGFQKFKDLFSLYSRSASADLPVKLEDFINENALILFNKEFTQKPEYQRFYKNIHNVFVTGLRYSLDSVVTDTIEKHISNLPIDTSIGLNFKTMKEKLDFCREVVKKSILT